MYLPPLSLKTLKKCCYEFNNYAKNIIQIQITITIILQEIPAPNSSFRNISG